MYLDLNKMKARENKLLKVFTSIINEMDVQVETLKGGINENNEVIAAAQQENEAYENRIAECQALKAKVEGIFE